MASRCSDDAFDGPGLLPFALSGQTTELVRLDEAAYRAASFLDGRLAAGGGSVIRLPWPQVVAAAPPPRPAHFLFHIGHCGSTLLARLLGEHPALFCLREPGLLRDLATGALPPGALGPVLGLYSRVWRPTQTALIKATSFVSEIAPDLLEAARGRALLLGVTPPAYLRGILGGDRSREEAKALAPVRQARLERRLGRALETEGEGERIALAWLCESAALQATLDAAPDRCLRLDFDRGLAQPAAWLRVALVHLGVDPAEVDLPGLVSGPLMRRYSKGPEHAYDSALRAAVLAGADRAEPAAVRAGMDWLQRRGGEDPRVARILLASAEAARRLLAPSTAAG